MFNSARQAPARRTSFRRHPSHGQLNKTEAVPEKWASLLNALGFSLPTGQSRERERRPAHRRRAPRHAPGALCANAVPARTPRVDAQGPWFSGEKDEAPEARTSRAPLTAPATKVRVEG